MIVVQNIFRAQFGKAKEFDLFRQLISISTRAGFLSGHVRLLTDVAGASFYTFILETTHESLAQWEQASKQVRGNAEWGALYKQLTPLIHEGERRIYSVVE